MNIREVGKNRNFFLYFSTGHARSECYLIGQQESYTGKNSYWFRRAKEFPHRFQLVTKQLLHYITSTYVERYRYIMDMRAGAKFGNIGSWRRSMAARYTTAALINITNLPRTKCLLCYSRVGRPFFYPYRYSFVADPAVFLNADLDPALQNCVVAFQTQ